MMMMMMMMMMIIIIIIIIIKIYELVYGTWGSRLYLRRVWI